MNNYIKYSLLALTIIILSLGSFMAGRFLFQDEEITIEELIGNQKLIIEGNQTYKVQLENYYNVEYGNNDEGFFINIKNDCIKIQSGTGTSMKPYWDNESLTIIDTCFPVEDLVIGDVITYNGEWDTKINPHHRIVDIDYEKRWVQTQGDNQETNPNPDDFVSFDRIMGKDIGVLNVLEDKRIVKKEVINDTGSSLMMGDWSFTSWNQTCVCSSTGVLRICHHNKTILEEDTFIKQNDLKEEYCDVNVALDEGVKE